MAAVRVSEALRYASKFVGLLLAVVIVAGGFLGGGVYLAADAISLSDPSLSALSETPVFIGVVLLVVGTILATIGLVALWYKFIADTIAAALAARSLGATSTGSDVESVGTEQSEASRAGVSAAGATEAEDRPVGEAERAAGPDSDAPEGDDDADASPPEEPPAAESSAGQPVDEPDSAVEEDAVADDAAVADEGPMAAGESAETNDEPPEWTPPDPSEFESTGADGDGDQWADESAEASDPAEESADESDPEEYDEDETLADQGVESFSAASEDDPLSDRLPSDDDA